MKSLTLKTKLYLCATFLAGIVIFISHMSRINLQEPWLLAALCVTASITLILKVEGSTNRSHYTFSFLVYGFAFAVFGTSEAILVIVVSNLVEWLWNKPAWFIQLFNTTSYIIVMQAAGYVYSLVNPADSNITLLTALGILLSMATFNMLNHLMVGIVVWLARGENFKQSGVFDSFPLMLDLTLLLFGASLSFVWNYNAFALVLFLVPLYLIYSTLRVPALERKTEIDSKTGLFNHEYFKKQFENELARANRFDRPLSVIIADLDLLRNINNTYGHLAGDEVLIGIAHAMKRKVRDYDVVSRFGGEEFAILLPETSIQQAFERAEIIRKAVEEMEFTVPTSMAPIRATLSMGIAHRENFNQTEEEITHNADLALYHSKLSGRNRSFALSNNIYVDFSEPRHTHPSVLPDGQTATEQGISLVSQRSRRPEIAESPVPVIVPPEPNPEPETKPSVTPVRQETPHPKYKHAAEIFIGGLALAAILALALLAGWSPIEMTLQSMDWTGLIVICALIVLSEAFSIDLYLRQTSLSTSAIPILISYILFDIVGIVLASLVLAVSLVIKYRSHFSRFIFNLSNHILAGSLVLCLTLLVGDDFLALPALYQVGVTLISAMILYVVTTSMVSIGMSLSLDQPAQQIWKEQFSWLAPYYLGIGLIAYAMIFGYRHNHVTGLLLMVIPMVLLRISHKQYVDRTREVVTELREKNQTLKKNAEEIAELNEGLLTTLSEIIDLRDPYVLGHSKQVSHYATDIATALGLKEKQVELIRKAGLLHDIGKLGISMEILAKPGKLTAEEYETIKEHAVIGGNLVKNTPSLRPLSTIIRHHHEHYNGGGYPDRLSGNKISIEARIISVADAIEAMASDRPYRRAVRVEKVMEELKRCAGTQFDPLVVEAAIQILGKRLASEPSQKPVLVRQPTATLDLNQNVQIP